MKKIYSNSFENWIEDVNLKNIEPFTLILFEKGRLTELRWDEKHKHVKNLSFFRIFNAFKTCSLLV